MNNELERILKEAVAGICLEGLRKTTETLGEDSRPRVEILIRDLPNTM
jgi:hypothetical protein